MEVIKASNEQQVSDLLDNFQWVSDPSCPESIPDSVDLMSDFAGKHEARKIAGISSVRNGKRSGESRR